MKSAHTPLLALALLLGTPRAMGRTEHILPIPQQCHTHSGTLHIPATQAVGIAGIDGCPTLVRTLCERGISHITFHPHATQGLIQVQIIDSIAGAHHHPLPGYADEAYRLAVTPSGILIQATSPMGVTRAAQTLAQMAEGWTQPGITLQCADITDWPAFKLRGYMHDVGRSYLSLATLERHIRLLARFKVNTFHWHLTENQAWRIEVKAYPQLTHSAHATRHAGQYYTQEECRHLQEYAHQHGITIIPEIDMPGHSAAFERAMGCDMQSPQGRKALKQILAEVAQVFNRAPYIHIGADEKHTTAQFVNEMVHHVQQQLGRRCVVWNPIRGVAVRHTDADLCQLWSTAGTAIEGKMNVDSRYNYANHFDVFADLVGIYKSTIYYHTQGSPQVAGTVCAFWNDRKMDSDTDIELQNNFYATVIASLSRAWQGGGQRYIDNGTAAGHNHGGGVMLPNQGPEYDDFENWERRFLFHKEHALRHEPIPYVRQTHIHWRITDPFPNGGNTQATFPPEWQMHAPTPQPTTYHHQGRTYSSALATGAGIYLRHTWGPATINAFYPNPQYQHTAYAWTYVYSPQEQTVGALIEFQNYGRSECDPAPPAGAWDMMGSRIWINGKPIPPPQYANTGRAIHHEVTLKNENFTARPPISVTLHKGWNKVFLKLPYINAPYRLDKWMFTCVFTDPLGQNAAPGLVYSPHREMEE